MTALVRSIQVASNWARTAIKKDNREIERKSSIPLPKRKQKFFLYFWQSKPRQNLNRTRANLVLANREARLRAPSGEGLSGENQWAALRAAHDLASKKSSSFIMVWLYNHARTYFSKNL